MLERLSTQVIVCPVIDAIDDRTFHYTFVDKDLYGTLNWMLEFEWHELSAADGSAKPDPWAPHRTPVMAGGLFAIHRKRFQQLGYYDESESAHFSFIGSLQSVS